MYGGVFLLQGGEFQRPWKRCSMVAKWPLEVEIAMGKLPVPIYVSSGHFALRYEVPKFLARHIFGVDKRTAFEVFFRVPLWVSTS